MAEAAALLDTTTAQITNTFETKQLASLALVNNSVYALALTAPGRSGFVPLPGCT